MPTIAREPADPGADQAADPAADPVLLLDTSAAVALLLADHDGHAATMAAVRRHRLGLAGPAWFETYAVLTRLPPGMRRAPADVSRILEHDFPQTRFLEAATTTALRGARRARRRSGPGPRSAARLA